MIAVEKFIERADYNKPSQLNNDIAILKLSADIKFTDKVKPACLPTDTTKVITLDILFVLNIVSIDKLIANNLINLDLCWSYCYCIRVGRYCWTHP